MAFRPSATNHEQIPSSTQHTQRSRLSFGAHFPPPSSLTTSHHLPSPYTDYYPSGMMNPSFRPILSEHMPYSSPSTPLHNTTIRRVLTPSTYGSVPSIRRRPATQNNHHRPDPTRNHMTQSYGLAGNTTNDQPRASTSFISTEPVSLFAVPPTSQHASELRQGPPSLNSDTPSHKANAGTAKAAGPIRKRRRTEEYDDVDEESGSNGANDDEEGLVANKACIRCNRDKVKCRYRSGSTTCVRCRQKGHQCQAREVKLSPSASRKKYVEAQLREKDAIIESLLKELYNPYRAHPLSVRTMEETSPRATDDHPETQEWRERLTKGADKTDVGIFSFCSPTDETGQSASPAHSPANHSPISESSRDGGPLDDAAPIEMLTKMSLEDRADAEAEERSDSSASSTAADDQAGPANAAYFKPGAGMDLRLRSKMELEYRTSPLISHKLMTEEDVLELFKIYHSKLNAFVPLLDPIIHTPQNAYARCPALFSVVCAVASRYYKKKSHMYPIVMHIARNEASTAVMNGWKSIELAQAFILLALWASPAKKWEDERGYLYTGIATRIAIDLNAHLCPIDLPKNEEEDRERLNKRRLWMICFETDWAMAAQYGKPASVKENQIIRTSDGFYHCSSFNNNLVGDIGLSAYNKLLRLVAKFHTDVYSNPDSRTGLRRDLDFPRLVEEYSAQLDDLQHEWAEKFAAHSKFQDDPVFELRCNLFPFVVEYMRLLMQSFEFQQALERGMQPQDRDIITRCINSATQFLRTFIWKLVPGGYLLYAPNGWINYGAFAAAFLYKLLRPQFSDLITLEERHMIIELITNLLDTLHSSQVAMDERHTPKLWAYFFEQLLAKLDRTLPVQASPTELVGSSSPEEWSGSVQPYPNAATSYYGQDPGLYQTYEVWSQMPDVNYWLHSQQSLQQYQSAGGFGQSMMGNEGLEYSYAMPDPNSLGSDNVMMPE